MRIEIEIQKEFECDYNGNKFKDFFLRMLCDIQDGVLCGNYEQETAEMLQKAFAESKVAYDTEKVVEKLEELKQKATEVKNVTVSSYACGMMNKIFEIVRKGGAE